MGRKFFIGRLISVCALALFVSAAEAGPQGSGSRPATIAELPAPGIFESYVSGHAQELWSQGKHEQAIVVLSAYLRREGADLPLLWDFYLKGLAQLDDYLKASGHTEDAKVVADAMIAALEKIEDGSPQRLSIAADFALAAKSLATVAKAGGGAAERRAVISFADGAGKPTDLEIAALCAALSRAGVGNAVTCARRAATAAADADRIIGGGLSDLLHQVWTHDVIGREQIAEAIAEAMGGLSPETLSAACHRLFTNSEIPRCVERAMPSWFADLIGKDDAAIRAFAEGHAGDVTAAIDDLDSAAMLASLRGREAVARTLVLLVRPYLAKCPRCSLTPKLIDVILLTSGFEQRRYEEAITLATSLLRYPAEADITDAESRVEWAAMRAAAAGKIKHANPEFDRATDAEFARYLALVRAAQPQWNQSETDDALTPDIELIADGRPDLLLHFIDVALPFAAGPAGVGLRYDLLVAQSRANRALRHYKAALASVREADALAQVSLTPTVLREAEEIVLPSDIEQLELATAASTEEGDLSRKDAVELGISAAQRIVARGAGDTFAWTALALEAERQGHANAVGAVRDAWITEREVRREMAARVGGVNLWTGAKADRPMRSITAAGSADLYRKLTARIPNWRAVVGGTPLSTARLGSLLGPQKALLFLIDAGEQTWIAAISHDGMAMAKSRMPSEEARTQIEILRRTLCLSECASSAHDFDRARAHRLYQALFGDQRIAAIVAGSPQLVINPTGVYTSLPFNVLVMTPPAGRDGDADALRATDWFGLRKAIQITTSVQSLASREGRLDIGNRYLGVAPRFNPDGVDQDNVYAWLPSLANAEAEVRAQAGELAWADPTLLVGPQATEVAVRALSESGELAKYSVINFATHALVANDLDGLLIEPALALSAPANGVGPEDGLLSASMVARLRLGSPLVVLSACNTAAGRWSTGDGLSGLARAFLIAGASALLVTHWEVDDAIARRITTGTLKYLKDHPTASPSEGLRSAMERVASDQTEDGGTLPFSHPAAWAPFIVIDESVSRGS